MYRFFSGSLRLKIVPRSDLGVGRYRIETNLFFTYGAFASSTAPDPDLNRNGAGRHITYTDITPYHEITVPYYCNTPCNILSADQAVKGVPRPCVSVVINLVSGPAFTPSPASFDVFIAAGDDFNFGYIVAPPPIAYP